mmetsp:Transcript_14035/g.10116  ORF Transcript_14035/g.10116 Transcript_14035/m.10116 type:complete len:126 (+) Transcript_14035:436-813(+)
MRKKKDDYLQLHMNCSIPSSLALSALTNAVYQTCDIWNGFNSISAYTYILQSKIQEVEFTNKQIKNLWELFRTLQNTDFNKKVEQNHKKQKDYKTTKEWFDAMMKDIHFEIKDVISQVRSKMKED